jgi:hypothetical protein
LWIPTWFAYAFLRRLATLEAVISLPARPFPAGSASRRTSRAAPQEDRSEVPDRAAGAHALPERHHV